MRQALPGDLLIRPVPIAAGTVLALNDHVLKGNLSSAITGKLSDAAGLVFVPLLLLALLELGRAACRGTWPIGFRDVAGAVVLVGGALIAAKLSIAVAHGLGEIGGLLQFPFRGHLDALRITHDPADLLTLPALVVTVLEARSVIRARKPTQHGVRVRRSTSASPTT